MTFEIIRQPRKKAYYLNIFHAAKPTTQLSLVGFPEVVVPVRYYIWYTHRYWAAELLVNRTTYDMPVAFSNYRTLKALINNILWEIKNVELPF